MRFLKKSQASMEFIMLFGIVLIIFVIFMALTADRLKEATEDRDTIAMKTLGDNIRNEVTLATQVKEFYIRRFKLPLTLNGKPYNIKLEGDRELKITLDPDSTNKKEYITLMPVPIIASFFEKIEEEFLDHCVIKKPDSPIRISRNQAYITSKADGQESSAITLSSGETFTILINLDCIDAVGAVQFTIKYDKDKLEFDGKPMCDPTAMGGKYQCTQPNDILAACPASSPEYPCYQKSAYDLNVYGYRPGDTFNSGEGMVDPGPPQTNAPAYTNLEASPSSDLTYIYDTPLYLNFKTPKEADCINTQPTGSSLSPYQGKKCWDKSEGILTFGFVHRTGMKDAAQVAEIQFKAKSGVSGNTKIEFLSLTVPGFVEEIGGIKRLPETRLPLNIQIT